LSKLPFVLVVSGDSPYKTVGDLADDLRRRGDKGSYGSIGNTGIVGSELFKAQFGLKTLEVKYKDIQACLNDLTGGNLAFAHVDPTGGAAQIKSGKIRALATTAADRFKALPDIPSAKEVGISNYIIAWWSVHTPKGTPKPIREKLETWFNEIAVAEDTVKFLAAAGSDPLPGTSASLTELLLNETKAWAEYVRIAKIEPLS
jgi:tripartite-type tricarboxylate transporter receptor subunit TctC